MNSIAESLTNVRAPSPPPPAYVSGTNKRDRIEKTTTANDSSPCDFVDSCNRKKKPKLITTTKKHVSWAADKTIQKQQQQQSLTIQSGHKQQPVAAPSPPPPPPLLPDDYDETDIWYTRKDYEEFLVDRVRTVQCLRAVGGNDKALDSNLYCIRGLEPFHSTEIHEEFHSKRHFHQSTIIVEQVRQSMLGIRDPERFRFLVATQSELSLRRAQEIAALDEHEVYNRVCRRNSLLMNHQRYNPMTTMSMRMPTMPATAGITAPYSNGGQQRQQPQQYSLSLSDSIRKLQEWNARRLVEIYSQPPGSKNSLFRFQIRRDSLALASASGGSGGGRRGSSNVTSGTRFQLRRDSLTPMSSSIASTTNTTATTRYY